MRFSCSNVITCTMKDTDEKCPDIIVYEFSSYYWQVWKEKDVVFDHYAAWYASSSGSLFSRYHGFYAAQSNDGGVHKSYLFHWIQSL